MSATSQLQQINARYLNTEDRILLRSTTSNQEEYLIWLTRRYTSLLLDALAKEIEQRGGTTTISSKPETKSLFDQGVFDKPYVQNEPVKRPLGEQGMLAYALKTVTDPHGNLLLEIQSKAGQGITYNLNDSLLYMLFSLLTQCVAVANWQIGDVPDKRINQPVH